MSFTVGIPAYNEAANIGALLEALLSDQTVGDVIVSDDLSDDGTDEIVARFAAMDPRVTLIRGAGRQGQIAGWLNAARASTSDTMVFMDADSTPDHGAAARLAAARIETGAAIVSGRIVPFTNAGAPSSRFSAEILHHLRVDAGPSGIVIGRFFAVDRLWFLENCRRMDIIANDAYLGCLAARQGRPVSYVPEAVIRYIPPDTGSDFAAQRQRADAGYRQLRNMGLLRHSDDNEPFGVLRALAFAAAARPLDLLPWCLAQIESRFGEKRYTVPADGHVGIWQTQASTKRRPGACE